MDTVFTNIRNPPVISYHFPTTHHFPLQHPHSSPLRYPHIHSHHCHFTSIASLSANILVRISTSFLYFLSLFPSISTPMDFSLVLSFHVYIFPFSHNSPLIPLFYSISYTDLDSPSNATNIFLTLQTSSPFLLLYSLVFLPFPTVS